MTSARSRRGGQTLDASIVPVPRTQDTRAENKAIKNGEVPEGWADKPAMRSQKDTDARSSEEDQKTVRGTVFPTNKHGKSRYGYKYHVNVDRRHRLIRRHHVSNAALRGSQAVDHLLMRGNTGSGVWADAACRCEAIEAKLRARGLKSHTHRKGKRGKPLTEQGKGSNRTKSTARARVEQIFGAQTNDMGGTLLRTIGMARA